MEKLFAFLVVVVPFSHILGLQGSEIVQPRLGKVCYNCTGIQCTRSDYIDQKTTCADILDTCATIYEGRTVVARGCYAEIPDEYKIRCESNPEDCETCSTLLCNEFAHPSILCAQCNSTANANCLAMPSKIPYSRCPFSSAYEPLCFVRFNGSATIRGCSSSMSAELECLQDNDCLVCAELGCNTAEFPRGRRQCLTCSGKFCSTPNATSMYCNKVDDECVSMVLGGNSVKGCLNSVEESQRSSCSGSNLCHKCDANNCNIIDPNVGVNHAFAMKVSLLVIMAATIISRI